MNIAAIKYPIQTQIHACHHDKPSTIIEEAIIHVFWSCSVHPSSRKQNRVGFDSALSPTMLNESAIQNPTKFHGPHSRRPGSTIKCPSVVSFRTSMAYRSCELGLPSIVNPSYLVSNHRSSASTVHETSLIHSIRIISLHNGRDASSGISPLSRVRWISSKEKRRTNRSDRIKVSRINNKADEEPNAFGTRAMRFNFYRLSESEIAKLVGASSMGQTVK